MAMHPIVGLPALDFWNPLDPFGSLAEELRDAYKSVEGWLSKFLANPPQYSDRGILPELYKIGSSNAEWIVYVVFLLVVMVGVALMKGRSIAQAFLVWIVISAISPIYIQAINAIINASSGLTAALNFYAPQAQGDPPIDNAILGAILFVINLGGAISTAGIIFSYEPVIVFVKFFGLVAASFWALGKRSRQVTKLIIAVGLVAIALGRPIAQFILEIGQIMRDNFPGNDTLVVYGIVTIPTYVLANLSQIVLIFAMYTAVSAVEGRMVAAVKGTVVSTIKHTLKVDINRIRRQQVPPQPVYTVTPPGPTTKDRVHRATRAAGRKASTAAGAGFAAAGQPGVGLAVSKGGNHAFREGKPPKR